MKGLLFLFLLFQQLFFSLFSFISFFYVIALSVFLSLSHSFAPKSTLHSPCLWDELQCGSPLSQSFAAYLLSAAWLDLLECVYLEAQPARRVGDWLGGWEAVARKARSGPRAAGFSPSVKSCVALLFARSIFLFRSVSFFFFFFLARFLRWGKNLRRGLFVLVWCRFSHVLGRFSYLHDSSLNCEGLS